MDLHFQKPFAKVSTQRSIDLRRLGLHSLNAMTTSAKTKKSGSVNFRCTSAERLKLEEYAKLSKISVSELLRRGVEGMRRPKASIPAVNLQTHAELGSIGKDLRELGHVIKAVGLSEPERVSLLEDQLSSLECQLTEIRLQVLGAVCQSEGSP